MMPQHWRINDSFLMRNEKGYFKIRTVVNLAIKMPGISDIHNVTRVSWAGRIPPTGLVYQLRLNAGKALNNSENGFSTSGSVSIKKNTLCTIFQPLRP